MSDGLPNNTEGRWYKDGVEILAQAANLNYTVSGVLNDLATGVISPNKNLIIGGNFDTNPWQRGTTFTSPAANTYTADRIIYKANSVTSGTITVTQSSDAPTVTQAGIFSSNSYLVTVTGTVASPGATETYAIGTKIEGYDYAQIAQRAFTISFWVKSNTTGTYNVTLLNSGSDRAYVTNYTINSANTWEKKTITVSASPSAGTWNYTNGIGLQIYFILASGDSGQTANTWTTFSHWTATANVNLFAAANTFKLALIQVEPGNNATAFEVRSRMQELALCQRYYEKSYPQGTNPGTAGSAGLVALTYGAASTNGFYLSRPYVVPKRATPTIVSYDSAGASGKVYNGGNGKTADISGTQSTTTILIGTADATSTNDIGYHFTADSEL